MTEMLTRGTLLRYAIFGLPLGFIGLPLYVHLPKFYADTMPSSLAVIGVVMLVARLLDCFADPLIGFYADRFWRLRLPVMRSACVTVAVGVVGLFFLPSLATPGTEVVWMSGLLSLTYLSYSVLMIYFYAMGLNLAHTSAQTVRVSAWREGVVIVGVLFASAIPTLLMSLMSERASYQLFAGLFVGVLAVAAAITLRVSHLQSAPRDFTPVSWRSMLANRPLRWVFALFLLNAIPPSITATLFLFFATDIIQAPLWSGGFLAIYFLSAVLAMPIWARVVSSVGKRRALMVAMGIAIASFIWAYWLGAGDVLPFAMICVFSGVALAGDLTILPSLLADVVSEQKSSGGFAFGIWNFISKFTLALAAGIALPLLYYLGYSTQTTDAHGLTALSLGYALLPCLFKCAALILLTLSPIAQPRRVS